ncbi:MAG: hypothetical protein R3B47_09000 [Bacteroidia bacterium]
MRKSRLISHLKAFDAADWRKLMLMAESPFFNQNQRVLALIRYLSECAPDFDQEKVAKKAVFQVLYPEGGKPFSVQVIHDHFSMGLRLLEAYLVQKSLEDEPEISTTLMLRSLNNLGLNKAFDKKYQQLFSLEQPAVYPDSYFHRFQLHLEAYNQAQSVRDKTALDLIDRAERSLDSHFVVNKLKIAAARLNQGHVYDAVPDEDAPAFLQLEHEFPAALAAEPLVAVYIAIHHLLQAPSGLERYDALVALLDEYGQRFSRKESTEAYAFVLNFAIQRFNKGETDFISRIFDLYKRLLNLDLLIQEDGHFPHAILKNIVTAGLRNKAFDWTRRFIESYTEKVHPDRRSDVYAYNMAMYHFEKGNYREALRGLSLARFKDVFYELGARTLQVKIYFEMEEDESIGYLLRAFRAALRRNKSVSRAYFKLFDNFLRFVNKLYKLKMNRGRISEASWKANWNKLADQLDSQEEGIANAMWLREKLDALQ